MSLYPEQSNDEHIDEENQKWYHGPLKYILGLFLLLLLIISFVPAYIISVDPSPGEILSVDQVFSGSSNQTNFSVNSMDDYYSHVRIDGEVKKVADKISVNACSESRICYAKALFLFVRDKISYINDPVQDEFVKSPTYTLETGSGDCDDQSVLLASLLSSIGIRTRFVFEPGHVYVQAYLPDALFRYKDENGWVNLDPTCKYCEFGEIA